MKLIPFGLIPAPKLIPAAFNDKLAKPSVFASAAKALSPNSAAICALPVLTSKAVFKLSDLLTKENAAFLAFTSAFAFILISP